MIGLRKVFLRHRIGVRRRRIAAFVLSRPQSTKSTRGSDDDCVEKRQKSKCVNDLLPQNGPLCSRPAPDICQGPVKVPPLPIECKSDPPKGPVYDKTCVRPYNNPCLPDISKTCKCNMTPRPCLAPCEKKRRQMCLGEPDCAYERKIDWGYRLMQVLLGVGLIIGGLILYRLYGKETKKDGKRNIIAKQKERRFQRPMELIKIPASSTDIPDKIDYLLIGGGTASYAAQKAIKSVVNDAKILIISQGPPFKPAMRPPLSSGLWKDPDREKALNLEYYDHNGKIAKLYFEPDSYYTPVQNVNTPKGGVGVAQGWSIKRLNIDNRIAILDDGKQIKFDKCLLATGGRPKIPQPFNELDNDILSKITFYRDSFDFQELEETIQEGMKCIAVVGGGLLGTEMAAALRQRTKDDNIKIVNVVKGEGHLRRLLPTYLSDKITEILSKRGIHVLTKTNVEDAVREGNSVKLYVSNDKCVVANHVVVAAGIEPNVDLAVDSCLELDDVNGGFLVNAEMESRGGIYAAGDCASFYDCALGRRREEHHSFALTTGQIAGENMTGKKSSRMTTQPSFWCDLSPDYVIEGTGIVDASKPTVGVYPRVQKMKMIGDEELEQMSRQIDDIKIRPLSTSNTGNDDDDDEPKTNDDGDLLRVENGDEESMRRQSFHKGVVFYLNDKEEIVGIVLLNLPGRLSKAQTIIRQRKKYDDIDNLVQEFDLHAVDKPASKKGAKRSKRD